MLFVMILSISYNVGAKIRQVSENTKSIGERIRYFFADSKILFTFARKIINTKRFWK